MEKTILATDFNVYDSLRELCFVLCPRERRRRCQIPASEPTLSILTFL
ncbi:unnamed protein product [Brassica rapa subsp. trilocularis]